MIGMGMSTEHKDNGLKEIIGWSSATQKERVCFVLTLVANTLVLVSVQSFN
jgi:hypothetical protein